VLVRPLVGGARLVIAASSFLAEEARRLGAKQVDVIPAAVQVPRDVSPPDEPPHVLFVGRLSEEKGILDFLAATDGLPRVIVGDGPLRGRVPEATGYVPPSEVGTYYERAAVLCVPSRREGYGMAAREAMAYGRPVVTTGVGGLAGLGDGAVVVDRVGLRDAIVGLLDNAQRRAVLGAAARATAEATFSTDAAAAALIDVYRRTQISTPPEA
jgi:glycosyltransferase involved in cell wall biosynthesis